MKVSTRLLSPSSLFVRKKRHIPSSRFSLFNSIKKKNFNKNPIVKPKISKKGVSLCLLLFVLFVFLNRIKDYFSTSKASLPRPHTGHSKSSGMSSHLVPGAIPWLGSPTLGSYSYPQGQTCLFISEICFFYL